MRSLCVLYDSGCGLCVYCRKWVQKQTAYFTVEFLPQGSKDAKLRYPSVQMEDPPDELIAIDDQGYVYKDEKAWLMILYALHRYRRLAIRLAENHRIHMTRRAYHWVSSHRYDIASRLWSSGDLELRNKLDELRDPPKCTVGQNRISRFVNNRQDFGTPIPMRDQNSQSNDAKDVTT